MKNYLNYMFLFQGYFHRIWHHFLRSLESYKFPLFQFCFQGQIYISRKQVSNNY